MGSTSDRNRVPGNATETPAEFEEVTAVLREWGRPTSPSDTQAQQQRASSSRAATGVSPAAATKSEEEKRREVAQALLQVQAAIHSAESKLEDIPNLPSARPKQQVLVRVFHT